MAISYVTLIFGVILLLQLELYSIYVLHVMYIFNDLASPIFALMIIKTSRVPVEGKSSVCLICMKYRIIFLIIIIISLGQILLSYIANTSRTNGRTHANACARTPHTHTPSSPYRYSMGLCQPTVTVRSAGDNS